jgi:hypothetical protein
MAVRLSFSRPGAEKKHPVLRLPQRTVDSTAVTAHHLSCGTGSHEMARIGGYSTRTIQGTLRERGALMKKWSVFIACLWAFQVSAQSTYPAAGCSQAQIQAAIAAEQAAAADGDIISIPAGSCTWTGTQQVSATFTTSVTIQGAGAVSTTSGGASTTGTDQTIIIDNFNYGSGPGTMWAVNTIAGKSFRFTGISIQENGSSQTPSAAILVIGGNSTAVRVDHCHFFMTLSAYDVFYNQPYGVMDHDYFQATGANGGLRFEQPGSDQTGHVSWNTADQWGTANFVYVEDSQFNRHGLGDCHLGGRFVIRYSTITSPGGEPAPYMANHGVDPGGRSCRASELYMNTASAPVSPGINHGFYANNGGPALFWGNTSSGYLQMFDAGYTRTDNASYNYGTPPTGWGYCSTSVSTGWDGVLNSPSGYPCMDQPARGQGDLLEGYLPSSSPGVCNETQGCPSHSGTWPRQALSPFYVWDNNYTPATGYGSGAAIIGVGTSLLTDNQDYYQQFGTYGESGSFNGTTGVGCGNGATAGSADSLCATPTVQPSTCTAGNSAFTTLYNSAGQAPGVGYWNRTNNTLYVCTATNTWTAYYTPYTYPNPLTQSSQQGASVPAPPTGLVATVQ